MCLDVIFCLNCVVIDSMVQVPRTKNVYKVCMAYSLKKLVSKLHLLYKRNHVSSDPIIMALKILACPE